MGEGERLLQRPKRRGGHLGVYPGAQERRARTGELFSNSGEKGGVFKKKGGTQGPALRVL